MWTRQPVTCFFPLDFRVEAPYLPVIEESRPLRWIDQAKPLASSDTLPAIGRVPDRHAMRLVVVLMGTPAGGLWGSCAPVEHRREIVHVGFDVR